MSKYCSVIVENRNSLAIEAIEQHRPFIPDDWDLIWINKKSINNAWDYSQYLTTLDFWKKFESYDRVLIFQEDSKLLRTGIEEFLKWDFIGAPWQKNAEWRESFGGNGGLSIRNPKKHIEALVKYGYNEEMGVEDVYFSNTISKIGNVAPDEISQWFSVECLFKLGTLGCHKIEKYFTKEQCNLIENQYIIKQ